MRDVIWLLAPRASNWSELSHRLQSISSRILDGVKHEIVVEGEPPEGKPAIEWSERGDISQRGSHECPQAQRSRKHPRLLSTGVRRLLWKSRTTRRGFDTSRVARHQRNRLENLEQRAALLRASLDIERRPGEGTTVRLSVPFSKG